MRTQHWLDWPISIYVAIPASSAASERVFSAAGNVVTKKRNKLRDDTVNALVFSDGSHGLARSSGILLEAGRTSIFFRVAATVGFVSTYASFSV